MRRREGRRRRRMHPLAITAIVIGAIVFVTYYAFNRGLPFVHKFTLYAVVSNSVNVRSDSPVRIAGIDVGSVQGVSPDGNASKIAFTVDSNGQPIHADATIRIRDRLFLEGGYYLELDPGSPAAPILHDGGMIPQAQTSSPVQFYNVLSTFDVATRASLENLLNTLNEGFGAAPGHPLSDSGAGGLKAAVPQLTPTVKDVAWVSRALQGVAPGDVQRLLSSIANVSTTLAHSSAQLAELVTALNVTSSALVASDGQLAQSVVGLDQTLQVSPPALSAIDRTLPPVSNLAAALDPSLKLAPPILAAVTRAVRELEAVVAPSQRRKLLSSLKATFQQFPAILTQLAVAFPIAKQITDCLQTHVTPLLSQQVPDGPLSTGRPVWQDFVHFLPGIAAASGGFDANGPWTRVLAGAGTNTLSGGLLGSLPGVGQLIGTAPPGGSSLLGARPAWVGDLTASDFRPDVPCSTQPVPSLASPVAASDLRSTSSPASAPLTPAALHSAIASVSALARKALHGR